MEIINIFLLCFIPSPFSAVGIKLIPMFFAIVFQAYTQPILGLTLEIEIGGAILEFLKKGFLRIIKWKFRNLIIKIGK